MDGQRFDALTRTLGGGLPRRGTLKALAGAALAGAATRTTPLTVESAGHLGDHCTKNDPCTSPLVCINTECDHCRKEGDCQTGWCCKGYSCSNQNTCVACSSSKSQGVVSEGCKKKKKKRKKKH